MIVYTHVYILYLYILKFDTREFESRVCHFFSMCSERNEWHRKEIRKDAQDKAHSHYGCIHALNHNAHGVRNRFSDNRYKPNHDHGTTNGVTLTEEQDAGYRLVELLARGAFVLNMHHFSLQPDRVKAFVLDGTINVV